MRLLSWGTLRDYADGRKSHADHKALLSALRSWKSVVEAARWSSFAEVRADYRSADTAGDRVVFDICGNNYRIVVRIDYAFQMVLVQFVGTHEDYDRITASKVIYRTGRKDRP